MDEDIVLLSGVTFLAATPPALKGFFLAALSLLAFIGDGVATL